MSTTILAKSLEQHMAEEFPLECCEGAKAVVTMHDQAHFLAGSTTEYRLICSKCLRDVKPVTITTLRPTV